MISGFLTALGSWFSLAQANGFPIAAGVITSLGFLVLLVADREIVFRRSGLMSASADHQSILRGEEE